MVYVNRYDEKGVVWGGPQSSYFGEAVIQTADYLNTVPQILYWADSFNKSLLSIYCMAGSVLYSDLYWRYLRGRYNNLSFQNLDYGIFFSFL